MRARELAPSASRSRLYDVERSTTVGSDIAVNTIDDVPTKSGAGSGKSDPRAWLS